MARSIACALRGAHAIDLARGSPLIGASLAGPNPKGGARFFGIGNELEILLSLEVIFGLGAFLTVVPPRFVRWGFGIGTLIAAAIIGSGPLGADVGGVVTLGAGGAGPCWLAGAPPEQALGGDRDPGAVRRGGRADRPRSGDLRRRPPHAVGDPRNGPADLLDNRQAAADHLRERPQRLTTTITCAVGILAFYLGVRRRHELYADLGGHPAFMAGIWGALTATVVGSLANDSGPLIFEAGLWMLLFATGYARSRPEPRGAATGPAPAAVEKNGVQAPAVG